MSERARHLIDGRRVRLTDLLEAGLLDAGTRLEFHQPRLARRHRAIVREDGRLELEDGRVLNSPSRAAGVASGGSIDGWYAWRIPEANACLDDLRQALLDRVGEEGAERREVGAGDGALARHDFLKQAREAAGNGSPIVISVRELIGHWDAKSRGQVITEKIENDLANHGLSTDPHFRKVGLDSFVALRGYAAEEETVFESSAYAPEGEQGAVPAATGAAVVGVASEEAAEVLEEVGLTLGNIPSANTEVASINPAATFDEAITKMLLNDFSQLAVMSNPPRGFKGAVTWQSIARVRHENANASLRDAIVVVKPLTFDTELIDVLPMLQTDNFVFVEDQERRISGIVTAADVVQAYGQMATPFFLIGELDQMLRRLISETFTIEQLVPLCDGDGGRNLQSYDDLTMGDYERILQNRDNWEALDWPLDRKVFTERLGELREVRNDVVHFNPDPIDEDAVGRLRTMVQVLKRFV